MAAVSVVNSNDSSSSVDTSTQISVHQYNQLMELLNKSQLTTESPASQHQSEHAMLAGKVCLLANNITKSGWLLDSGATDHICSYLSSFLTYTPVTQSNEFIVVPDGRQIQILHTGSVHIHKDMILHIPTFQYNLISVQRLCQILLKSLFVRFVHLLNIPKHHFLIVVLRLLALFN